MGRRKKRERRSWLARMVARLRRNTPERTMLGRPIKTHLRKQLR